MNNFKITLGLFLVIMLGICCNGFALNITPSRYELDGISGDIFEKNYLVYNETDKDLHITVKLKKWFDLEQNENIIPEEWIKIEPSEFDIKSKEEKNISIVVSVPEKAQGFIMAMVSFVPETGENTGVGMVMSIPVYVKIKGTEVFGAEIGDVGIRKNSSDIQVGVVVKNTGNVYFRPKGKAIITNKKEEIAAIDLKYGLPVYPFKDRSFIGSWSNGVLNPGKYNLKIEIMSEYSEIPIVSLRDFEVEKNGEIITK